MMSVLRATGIVRLDPRRGLAITGDYVRRFFDVHLSGAPPSLLEGPSVDYPELQWSASPSPSAMVSAKPSRSRLATRAGLRKALPDLSTASCRALRIRSSQSAGERRRALAFASSRLQLLKTGDLTTNTRIRNAFPHADSSALRRLCLVRSGRGAISGNQVFW